MELSAIVLTIAGFFSAYFIKQLSDNVHNAVSSIQELNAKVAVIIERTETHGHEIETIRAKQDAMAVDIALIKTK
jgi:hypothetical protein